MSNLIPQTWRLNLTAAGCGTGGESLPVMVIRARSTPVVARGLVREFAHK